MDISDAMIQAILFDMDDLMVNSAPLHVEASKRVFLPLGVDIDEIPDDVIAGFFGKKVSDILQLIADYFSVGVDLEKIHEDREKILVDMVMPDLEPMPGLFELIDFVKTNNYKRALASSGTKGFVMVVLEKFKLVDFFQAIATGDMVKNGKPAPDVFLKAAELLGVDPASCLVIEDSTAGVSAAKSAGMYCVGVFNPVSVYKQDLSAADVIVDRLDEIDMKLLKKLAK